MSPRVLITWSQVTAVQERQIGELALSGNLEEDLVFFFLPGVPCRGRNLATVLAGPPPPQPQGRGLDCFPTDAGVMEWEQPGCKWQLFLISEPALPADELIEKAP